MQFESMEQEFQRMREEDLRRAAEIAFAIAMTAKSSGDIQKATEFGRQSVQLFDDLNVQNMDDCVARYQDINGIAIPDLIHADVVRDRLRPLVI